MVNIYCDESCHLKITEKNKNEQQIMAIGGIKCNDIDRVLKKINADIRKLRIEYKIFKAEIKWTKISRGKIDFYKKLIDIFFENEELEFRIIIKDKRDIYYDKYTHEEIYYIMYYYLLREMISVEEENSIYIDKKDTNGGKRIEELKKCLCYQKLDFDYRLINKIQIVNSKDCELLQLADILIGAITYENRKIDSAGPKKEIINYIKEKTKLTLTKTVPSNYRKFNIFIWEGGRV